MIGDRCKVFTEDHQRGRARQRREGLHRAQRPDPGRLLQGPGEDREDVSDDRRRALLDPGRLVHRRGRRHAHAARPRQRVHQLRGREGLPRGGRGGAEDAPRRRGRAGRRRAGRALGQGGGGGRAAAQPGRRSTRRSCARTCASGSRRYKTPKRVFAVPRDVPRAERQGRLQDARRSSRRGSTRDATQVTSRSFVGSAGSRQRRTPATFRPRSRTSSRRSS